MSAKVRTAQRHDSALKHVTGQALYIDDMPEPPGTLHGALVLSTMACGRIVRIDAAAASAMPGVVAVLGPGDIPGRNDVAAIGQNEPLFAVDRVEFAGQTLAMVVAESLDAARAAAAPFHHRLGTPAPNRLSKRRPFAILQPPTRALLRTVSTSQIL